MEFGEGVERSFGGGVWDGSWGRRLRDGVSSEFESEFWELS